MKQLSPRGVVSHVMCRADYQRRHEGRSTACKKFTIPRQGSGSGTAVPLNTNNNEISQ